MKNKLKKVVGFLFEVGTLRKVARSHRQTLLTNDITDNISSHSYRVTMIGYFLSQLEKADTNKVLLMCLFHDLPESRTGDQHWINKKYVKVFEEEVLHDQFEELPGSKNLQSTLSEYQKRESVEAKIAKDADLIDQILLLKEYEWVGNKEATLWLKGKEQAKRLSTKSAKELVKEIYAQRPSNWWSKDWTANRR